MTIVRDTCVMTLPEEYWPNARKALRMLRELHREAGGTSRLVRKGEQTTLTLTGSHQAVLDGIRNAQKIQMMVNQVHSRKVSDLLDQLVRNRRAQRRATFAEMMEQAIRDSQGRGSGT